MSTIDTKEYAHGEAAQALCKGFTTYRKTLSKPCIAWEDGVCMSKGHLTAKAKTAAAAAVAMVFCLKRETTATVKN